jgi:hypothetical protein
VKPTFCAKKKATASEKIKAKTRPQGTTSTARGGGGHSGGAGYKTKQVFTPGSYESPVVNLQVNCYRYRRWEFLVSKLSCITGTYIQLFL